MNLKIIIISLLSCIYVDSALAVDQLLSMQQKYGFKFCQKMTKKIKQINKLICSPENYMEYLQDGFYDCLLTNKKMGLSVISYRSNISDITFSKIFNDTDYGYGIGGKNITPDLVKTQLAKHGLVWTERRSKYENIEINFGKTFTDDEESFIRGPGYSTNMVLLTKRVPGKSVPNAKERKAKNFYADFDSLCGDFGVGYSYRFDTNGVLNEIKFSSDIP